ncbi:uncharacterized protein RHOBADRAFT_53592 [Rhodotorula graminis WP1]|uniref:AMMECR1 domain-containing protein n=1 Tax=Rhodotorula graminis (strain WP1) TaxID=578459 RepID=A0A194S279_RHOGW|nr:uncharacterized protein RHOBADRAFT_53592 [Rhodotorula graminis WP1]KPV74624.1 hypothetical protein RHOBADRAFT_53592 [Rhodotorula graminis WP1]
MSSPSSGDALPEHAYYCFDVVQAALDGTAQPAPQFDRDEAFPLFVTWNVRSRSGGEPRLRGCIGNFGALRLGDGLAEYAHTSAFEDSRFDPITAKDLPRLECGVSLLTDFEVCDDYLDWELGTHGIYVEFVNPALNLPPSSSSSPASTATTPSTGSGTATPAPKPTYRSLSALPKLDVAVSRAQNPRNLRPVLHATFLPEVAPAQGWTKVDAVDAAMRKGGFKGVVTDEMRRGARVSRYQSRKVKVTWDEWQRWRSSSSSQ